MRKAVLVDIDHKKNRQIEKSVSLKPQQRLEYLFELIKFSKNFNPHSKVGISIEQNTFVLSRRE